MQPPTDPRNRSVQRVLVGPLDGGIGARIETRDGDVLIVDPATLAALVRGFVTVTTHPGRRAVELRATASGAGAEEGPAFVLLERDTEEALIRKEIGAMPPLPFGGPAAPVAEAAALPHVVAEGLAGAFGAVAAAPQPSPAAAAGAVPRAPARPAPTDPVAPIVTVVPSPPATEAPDPVAPTPLRAAPQAARPAPAESFDDQPTSPYASPPLAVGTAEHVVSVPVVGARSAPALPVLAPSMAPPTIVQAEPSFTGPLPAVPRVGGPTGPVTSSLPPPPGPRLFGDAPTAPEPSTTHGGTTNAPQEDELDDIDLHLDQDDGPVFGEVPTEGGRPRRR